MSIYASLVAFIAAASLLTIAPGLDTALVLRTAATAGPRRAALAGLGVAVLERPSVVQTCDRLTGGMFVAFGVGLALQSRRV
jgi:threonine/homoserine/homoserine lactone efflux protein